MPIERFPKNCLLLARDGKGNNAMASVVRSRVVIPQHVAETDPIILDPYTGEEGRMKFVRIPGRDLAFSKERILIPGFEKIAPPSINQRLTIFGYHGPELSPFEIDGIVTAILPHGRIVIDRLGGALAQPGMSGSPGTIGNYDVVGELVEGVRGTDGERLYLETLHGLPFNILLQHSSSRNSRIRR